MAARSALTARAWLRPALMLLGGLAVAAILALIHQWVAAVVLVLVALLMGYWTSPLRAGQHTPMGAAMRRRSPDHAIILWSPSDPLSARLQTAIRGDRDDVTWVNVLQDPEAERFLTTCGGRGALPLVIVGDEIVRRATMGAYLDAREEAADHAARHRKDAGRADWRREARPRDGSTDAGSSTATGAGRGVESGFRSGARSGPATGGASGSRNGARTGSTTGAPSSATNAAGRATGTSDRSAGRPAKPATRDDRLARGATAPADDPFDDDDDLIGRGSE